MPTILLISPYWREQHRWMVSSVKLADLWQKMGYRVVVVCMGKTPGNPERVSDTLAIYRVRDLFLPDPLNYGIAPTFLFHVLRVLGKEKPDIVIVNKVLFWSSLVTPILRLMGKKPIVTTDALVGMTWWPRSLLPKIIMAIGAWTVGWLVLLSAKKVVFFHPQPKALLKFLGIAGKSRVIPTGVDLARYEMRDIRHEKSATISSLESRVSVTYIGRLESVKGVDDFLEAAVPLQKRFPALAIQVVGWFKERHPLVERFKDSVTFTGLRDDIPRILRQTDIFVLPSYSEGLSNALMEAMASGCACIATRTGGNAYLLEHETSGLLFSPGNRAQLQEHLRRLLSDEKLRRSLGENARRRMKERFSSDAVMKEYARLFADVAG